MCTFRKHFYEAFSLLQTSCVPIKVTTMPLGNYWTYKIILLLSTTSEEMIVINCFHLALTIIGGASLKISKWGRFLLWICNSKKLQNGATGTILFLSTLFLLSLSLYSICYMVLYDMVAMVLGCCYGDNEVSLCSPSLSRLVTLTWKTSMVLLWWWRSFTLFILSVYGMAPMPQKTDEEV